MKVIFKKENDKKHKYKAIFYNEENKKIRSVKFGAYGYSDYTKHKDEERKQKYIKRHEKNENFKNYMSKGSLWLYILWNKPTIWESINDYKNKFNLK